MRRIVPSNTAGYVWARFVVAATPFAVLGVSPVFWAILAGLVASRNAERKQLVDFWHQQQP